MILLLLDFSAELAYFHASLIDLKLVVRHWNGFNRIERPRRQFVNGSTSERHILQFGVPQVSILGPFLYSL